MVVPLLQIFFVTALVVSYVAFVLPLFGPQLSFRCIGKGMFLDHVISQVSTLIFVVILPHLLAGSKY